ncbi:MAG: DUF484 family protein [Paracoccaceae bacterium]|nr:DUF484 family protein [Paracoccaceae bacterium]
MSETARIMNDLRERIISDPEMILEDPDVMRALIGADVDTLGKNIVDLRGIALERLETRLERLEDTHRSVIAAAYENLAGTNQIHRAVVKLLEPEDFNSFMKTVTNDVAEILRVDSVKVVLETRTEKDGQTEKRLDGMMVMTCKGFVDDYLTQGRAISPKPVTLRQIRSGDDRIFGQSAEWIKSEACLRVEFGGGKLVGMLVMGSEDPHQFRPNQGTDLLVFFNEVFERAMQRWLT